MKHASARNIAKKIAFVGFCGGVPACGGNANQWPAPVEEGSVPVDESGGAIEQVQQASVSSSWLVATGGVGLNTTTSDTQIGTDASSNFAIAIWVHGTRGLRVEPTAAGIPNLIGGSINNTVTSGAAGSAIAGGGAASHINTVTDSYGFVGGGQQNRAGNASGTVSDASYAVVGGGNANTASGPYSIVGGGSGNTANGTFAVVGGGSNNTASNTNVVVGGGFQNSAGGLYATCAGGNTNSASAQFATVSGGQNNIANVVGAAVGGGQNNHAAGSTATIGGGASNQVTANDGTVGGGNTNTAASRATVAGGFTNSATGTYSVVGGGTQNTSIAQGATVAGGSFNQANGFHATVPGGSNNIAVGSYGLAAGTYASADFDNCFVWSDGSNGTTPLPCGVSHGFVARAIGGVWFYSNAAANAGVVLTPGANAWAAASDRNAKQDFVPVNARDVLDRVAAMPVSTWTYKSEPGVRHMGPMAQDFRAAFGLGTNDKTIVTVDADGVALAAIKGLKEKLDGESRALREKLEAESRALRAENQALRSKLESEGRETRTENRELRERLNRLEARNRPAALAGVGPGNSLGFLAMGIGIGAALFVGRRRTHAPPRRSP